MKLGVLERIRLMEILPLESNYITFRILTDLKKSLSFTEEEMKELKMKQIFKGDGTGQVEWDVVKEKPVEIPMGEQANIIIKSALKKIDAEGKVNEGNMSLFEKFLPEIGLEVAK
jgi:hypothetical protein